MFLIKWYRVKIIRDSIYFYIINIYVADGEIILFKMEMGSENLKARRLKKMILKINWVVIN
jgi:hypothetical protein